MRLIVLTGTSEAGKDYLLQKLQQEGLVGYSEIVRRSFSDQLRDLSTSIFPWLPNETSQEFKNNPFDHPQNDNKLSPRDIWKRVAECVRGVEDGIFATRLASCLVADYEDYDITETLFVITDLRSHPEYEVLQHFKDCFPECNMDIIRIADPLVPKEKAAEIDKPTFEFEVDHVFVNHKTERCVTGFLCLVNEICNKE